MAEIRTKHLLTINLKAGKGQALGKTPVGQRLCVPVLGGSFQGERLKGTVEDGGSDWIIIRPDGTFQLNVRLVLRTHDGALIGMTYHGFRHGPAPVLERLSRGEPVDPSEYYFRTAPLFETADDKYDWLNRIVAIATGRREPDGPIYDVFEVL